jgi:hypothetical protein
MFSASKTTGPSGYNLTNSLRFRSSASAFLNRTPASAGNRQIFTVSVWVKRGTLGVDQKICSAYSADNDNGNFDIRFSAANVLYIGNWNTGLTTTAVFRDPSAWYHIVVAVDTTQATGSNRVRAYVNGVEYTLNGTAFNQNITTPWNNNVTQNIGRNARASDTYFDGYMDEFNNIDGQALTPSSFGSFNSTTGVWQPARYTGTYGTNGFYLNFTEIALTSGSNTGLGRDFSGNGNFWNTNNISVTAGITYDAMLDVPTLTSMTVSNYCTGNPLDVSVRGSFSNANLTATTNGGGSLNAGSVRLNTFNFTQLPVRWYWESTVTDAGATRALFGLITTAFIAQNENWSTTGGAFLRADGVTNMTNPGSFTAGDVMMFAYDGNTARFWIGKNGTWTNSGVPASGTNPNITLSVGTEYWLLFNTNTGGTATSICQMNFGQRPFVYTPPSGFVAVNTFNLPTSTIVKGNTVMDATLYTGNGANRSIVNQAGFRPDLVWGQARSAAYGSWLYDSVRGATRQIETFGTNAESIQSTMVTAFNSNGFNIGTDTAGNQSSVTYVAWQWQAGQGTNTTNTAGSITSTVSVNPTAGFSIVTYTGTLANATVGHGLGVAPAMIFTRFRGSESWAVYHRSLGNTTWLVLNATNPALSSTLTWNSTTPTSTVFSVGAAGVTNTSGAPGMLAYCWAAIPGFSAFGSYVGNGNADGPFIFTGFRPKFIMRKQTTNNGDVGGWIIFDTSRDPFNVATRRLLANSSAAEATPGNNIDILSNGWKERNSDGYSNASGQTYVYAAFAENPFKNSLAR